MNEREIFNAARRIAAIDERAAYLDTVCGDDAEVRRHVEQLLLAHDQVGGFLEDPCVDRPETIANESPGDPQPGGQRTQIDMGNTDLDFLSGSQTPGVLGRIGAYEVTEVIGRGGMGIVLKARDARLNRVVAVKVLAPELAGNAMARRRFVREAQSVAAVAHPHIVAIYSVDEERLPFLVMEFVDGPSLQEKIDREGHLQLREILRIGAQIAAGLAAAHAHGVIHRDIKPANILLENGVERVRITDFGLARAVDDVAMTRTGEVTGTPQYMSPEQTQGQPVDARSDLFSLGSVLYAMCTGRSPFRADTTMACLRRVSDDTPRPIREVNPDVPTWLVAIIDRLLEKEPPDRFQTAAEVAELLGKHLAHMQNPGSTPQPGVVRPIKRTAEPASPWRRRGLVAALILIALAAGFGVTEGTGVTEFSATVVRIVTGEGTLAIEIDDPTVQVSLDGEELSITGAGLKEITLRPGQYQFEAVKNEQPVKRELVTITRGGRRVVSVSMEGARAPTHESIAEDKAKAVEPWISLFNGRDLTGWMTHPSNPSGWTVKDGLLVGRSGPGDGYLFSDRGDFENFHLRIEAQINADADSGVFVRSEFGLSMKSWKYPAPFAYEVQIAGVNPNNGDQTGTLSNTAVDVLARRAEVLSPPDTWQRLEVIARGPRIIVKVDGKGITDYVDVSRAYSKGHVALQVARAAGVVRFRKIEIQVLASDGLPDDPYDAITSDEWDWSPPVNLGPAVNSEQGEFHPFLTADGLTLIFCSDRPGGQGRSDLWQSTRASIDEPWSAPVNLGANINSPSMEGNSLLSTDGLTLLVDSGRAGGQGGWDIWMHRRAAIDADWSEAINLGTPVNSVWGDGAPSLSSDGLVLVFHSDRPGGEGGNDLWMSHRSSTMAGWSEPIPLGASVNTQHDESGPRLSANGRALLFNSDRPGGQGHQDLWMSRGASAYGPWSKPVNLGPGLNAGGNDKHASFADGGRGLVFESGRSGNLGAHDLWMATRVPKLDHVRLANEHAAQGRLDEAAHEFSLALNLITDLNPHGSERARIVEQFILTDGIFARVMQLRPEDINLWSHRAHHLAKAGRWEESVACFQKRVELGPDGAGLWQVYSLALLAKHDDDAFRSLCEQMLAGFANNSIPGEAAHAALAMAVIPDAVQEKQQAFQLAERAVNGLTNDVWWISATYGAWLYRLDRLEEALIWLESAKDQDYQGFTLCFLAMAHHRLGHTEQAGRYVERIKQKQTAWTDATTWYHRVRVERLMVEMDAVLAGEPDDFSVPAAEEANALPIREDIDFTIP